MPNPMFQATAPEAAIYERVGRIACEWSWVEMLLGETLSHFCDADPGSMYVISHNVSAATITDWLRTLIQIKVKEDTSKKNYPQPAYRDRCSQERT